MFLTLILIPFLLLIFSCIEGNRETCEFKTEEKASCTEGISINIIKISTY